MDEGEMVRRVGDALREQCKAEFGSTWSYDVAWRLARAAIEAMREPTEEMVEAGVTADHGKTLGERVTNCHTAMLSAALSPSGEK